MKAGGKKARIEVQLELDVKKINWRLIEISNSYGRFLGKTAITVMSFPESAIANFVETVLSTITLI